MATPHPPSINLDSKLGAAFLGNILASIFYGITCVQTYLYFRTQSKDGRLFKVLIAFLWMLDTAHLAVITHTLYFYLVSNYGNLASLVTPTWTMLAQVYFTCVSDLIIRGIYGRRVWFVASRSYLLAGAIGAISLTTFVTGFVFTTRAFQLRAYEQFHQISYLLYTALATGVAADILIAGSLCTCLYSSRTGFKKTDSLVNILMLYAVNSSLLTTICAAACFITYTIWPNEFTYIGIYFSLSKLYFNSLLATLNGRQTIAEKISAVSNISELTMTSLPARRWSKGGNRVTQPVVVSIDTEVIEKYESVQGHGHAIA